MSVLAPAMPAPVPPPAGPHPWRWTREQYYRLGELGFFRGRRVELIRGEIVEMSPTGWRHSLATDLIAEALRRVFAGTAWVREQKPLPTDVSDVETDVAVIPGSPRDYTDHPTAALLVVEVSDTSLAYDTTTKAELYAEAGHPEYWVLDLDGRRLLVFRDPTPLAPGGTAYRTQTILGPADAVAPLTAPNSSIKVAELLP